MSLALVRIVLSTISASFSLGNGVENCFLDRPTCASGQKCLVAVETGQCITEWCNPIAAAKPSSTVLNGTELTDIWSTGKKRRRCTQTRGRSETTPNAAQRIVAHRHSTTKI